MTREAAIDRAHRYFDDSHGYWSDLARRVSIPTESQNPESLKILYKYLDDEMRNSFEAMDYTCKVYDNPIDGMGPVLLATRIEDENFPTLLGYGHGDVVRGYEGQWANGKRHGRGTQHPRTNHLHRQPKTR